MARHRLLILLPGNQLYGHEQALIAVARVLREEDIHCHFLIHSSWGRKIKKYLNVLDFSWTTLPLGTIWSLSLAKKEPHLIFGNIWAVFRVSFNLHRIIREQKATHIIMGNATFAYYLLPALLFSRIKAIYRYGDEITQHSIFHRLLNPILFRRMDWHVFNCLHLQKKLDKYAPTCQKKMIYNLPIRLLSSVNFSAKQKVKGNFRLLFVGQLAEHKGVLVLFEAFRILIKRYPNLILELVGDIPGVGHARPIKIASDIKRLLNDFPAHVYHTSFQIDLSDVYGRANLLVCPSLCQEASANVVLEAKSQGLPSVVFNVGGMAELISHKVDGYFCDELSSNALVIGIEYFLTNIKLLDSAGYMAKANFDQTFGLKRFKQQWLNVLDTTANPKKRINVDSLE